MTPMHIVWDRNVSDLPTHVPSTVYRPNDASDVIDIVRSHTAEQRLRSVSTGRNWGLGSATTADADTAVLDLSAMSRIRLIDEERAFAIIEPGVTQFALASELEGTDLVLNCTNSSGHTSVLGNAMDRGIGARGSRTDDLLGLELVSGTGRLGTVGWWPTTRGVAPNRHGLGPSLLHVFTQANLAVATAGVVQLAHRAEASDVVTAVCDQERSDGVVAALREIMRQGLSTGVVKFYDAQTDDGTVFAVSVCIEGTAAVVAAQRDEITHRLRQSGAVIAGLDDPAVGPTSRTILSLFRGELTENERLLRAATGVSAAEVDEHGSGWLFSVPMVPFTVPHVARAREIVAAVAADTGLAFKATGNVLNAQAVDLVISISFDRGSETTQAHAALASLAEQFAAEGFAPYRIDTSSTRSEIFDPDDLEGQLIRRIQDTFDPVGRFAPSRYSQ